MQSWCMGSVEILSHAGMWSVDIAALSATLCHLTAYSGNTKNNSWERVSCLPSSVALSLLPWGTWWWCPTRLAGDSHGAGTGWLGCSPIGVGCEESPWGLPARSEAALISSCSLSAHHVMASVCLAMSFLPAWLPGQTSSWAGPYGLLVPRHLTWLGATGMRALLRDTQTRGAWWLTCDTHFHTQKDVTRRYYFHKPVIPDDTRCFGPIPVTLQIWVKGCITNT